jgi:hypothetical protein
MMECIHCNQPVDTKDLAQTIAYETTYLSGASAGLEWADVGCEARSTGNSIEYIHRELMDGDTYLTRAQMEDAIGSQSEAAHELVQSR